jgi:hypothetical protein
MYAGPVFQWGDAIAFAALLISAALAILKFTDWRAKPDLHADPDWLAASGEPTRLNVVVSNAGRARGGVRALLLSPSAKHDPETSFSHHPMLGHLPAMVEPGDLALFAFEVRPEDPQTLCIRSFRVFGDHLARRHDLGMRGQSPWAAERRYH